MRSTFDRCGMGRWAFLMCGMLLMFLGVHAKATQLPQRTQGKSIYSRLGPESSETEALRQQKFAKCRALLLGANLPFDPNELLKKDWKKNLAAKMDQIPEMQQMRTVLEENLKGVYIADTLSLPEKFTIEGDTVILVKRLVYRGYHVEIIAPGHDVAFFIMDREYRFDPWNIGMAAGDVPTFMLRTGSVGRREDMTHFKMQNVGPIQYRLMPLPADLASAFPQPAAKLVYTVWRGRMPTVRRVDWENANGIDGFDGSDGDDGVAGDDGTDGSPGADGGPTHIDGYTGDNGTSGYVGSHASCYGGNGTDGGDAGNVFLAITTNGDWQVTAVGGKGGKGGRGGKGGDGGKGGKGGNGGGGYAGGNGGNGGLGANGGTGGDGIQGGDGGNGGKGGIIDIIVAAPDAYVTLAENSGGDGGAAGEPGPGGSGGAAGTGGTGGNAGEPTQEHPNPVNGQTGGTGGSGMSGSSGYANSLAGSSGAQGLYKNITYLTWSCTTEANCMSWGGYWFGPYGSCTGGWPAVGWCGY